MNATIPQVDKLTITVKEQADQIKKLEREITELKLTFIKLQSQIKRLQNP